MEFRPRPFQWAFCGISLLRWAARSLNAARMGGGWGDFFFFFVRLLINGVSSAPVSMGLLWNLVIALRGPVAQRRQDGGRERGLALLAFGLPAAYAAGAWEQAVGEGEQVGGRFGEERAELDGDDGQRRDDQLRLAALARGDDLARGALGPNRSHRQRVAEGEPCVLGAVTALEGRVARAARPHQSGADGRDDDVLLREFGAQAVGESGERELAGAVGDEVRHADLAADGRDVDDAPVAARAHLREHAEGRVERPPEVYGHRVLEVFERHLLKRPDLDDARVVDEHVHAAEMPRHHLDQLPDLRAVGHVAREGEGARPALSEA